MNWRAEENVHVVDSKLVLLFIAIDQCHYAGFTLGSNSLCNMKIDRVRHFARLDYFARAMACDANCFLSVVSHTCCQELLLLRRPFVL